MVKIGVSTMNNNYLYKRIRQWRIDVKLIKRNRSHRENGFSISFDLLHKKSEFMLYIRLGPRG